MVGNCVDEIKLKLRETKMKKRILSVLNCLDSEIIRNLTQLRKLCCIKMEDECVFNAVSKGIDYPIEKSALINKLSLELSYDTEKLYPIVELPTVLTEINYKVIILYRFLETVGLNDGAMSLKKAMQIAPIPRIIEVYLDYVPTIQEDAISKISDVLIVTKNRWVLDLTHSRKCTALAEIKCPISVVPTQKFLTNYECIINCLWGSVLINDKKVLLSIR